MECQVKGCTREAIFQIEAQLVSYKIIYRNGEAISFDKPQIDWYHPVPSPLKEEKYQVCYDHNNLTIISQLQKKGAGDGGKE